MCFFCAKSGQNGNSSQQVFFSIPVHYIETKIDLIDELNFQRKGKPFGGKKVIGIFSQKHTNTFAHVNSA